MITKDQFASIVPQGTANDFYTPLVTTLERYDITTPERIAAFLSQILHESSDLRRLTENLNYSAGGLVKTFPKYFNGLNALEYARKPQMIANKVYANRMGNGDEQSGDGWKFRGRGAIQITGHDNYKHLSEDLKFDFVLHPDWLTLENYALLSAGWYWDMRKINVEADFRDNVAIRQKVNGGKIGLDDTVARYNKYISIIKL